MTDKDFDLFPSPCYIMEEELLRKNLTLIKSVADRAGVEIILAFKSFAMWRSFPIFREYVEHSTASSVYEARLALEEFGSKAHTYSPAYTEADFPEIMRCSSHITFNSLAQFRRFYPMIQAAGQDISCGIRVNPEYSEVETELYNPCAPGTRFGVMAEQLPDVLPQGIDGFHCHCHCESSSYELERTLEHLEAKFSRWFPQIKWLNLGGGHLMTRKDYDVEHLIRLLCGLKERYPHLRIILEPGSAFTWQTGVLASEVVDIVENRGIRTAILNVSFTCHMPDCLEMPYQPAVRGHTGKGKPRPGKDIPIVIIELISVAVALGYTACTVAALHGGAGGYYAGVFPKAQRAALIYIFALSGHKVYDLVPAKLIKFSGMCV